MYSLIFIIFILLPISLYYTDEQKRDDVYYEYLCLVQYKIIAFEETTLNKAH